MIDIIYRFDPDYRREKPPLVSADAARQQLENGNRQFAELFDSESHGGSPRIMPFDLLDMGLGEVLGAAPTQAPFAVVLGCSDARVPIELIFNQACNDLFVVRVAGNVLGNECLGSIDYAVKNLGSRLRLLVVLGHSSCGAVTAAVDAFLDPKHYLALASSHSLRAIIDRVFIAVRSAANAYEQIYGVGVAHWSGYRKALIETSIVLNSALTAYTLAREERSEAGTDVGVCYGIYDLVLRRVGLPLTDPETGGDYTFALAAPPSDEQAFDQLALRLATSEYSAKILGTR